MLVGKGAGLVLGLQRRNYGRRRCNLSTGFGWHLSHGRALSRLYGEDREQGQGRRVAARWYEVDLKQESLEKLMRSELRMTKWCSMRRTLHTAWSMHFWGLVPHPEPPPAGSGLTMFGIFVLEDGAVFFRYVSFYGVEYSVYFQLFIFLHCRTMSLDLGDR
ncbi:unnamed protein product, partial [Cuscuta europaea]